MRTLASMMILLTASLSAPGTAVAGQAAESARDAGPRSGLGSAVAVACQEFDSGSHVISNAVIQGEGDGADCLVISGTASVVVENSDISRGANCVLVTSSGRVVLRNNRIHGCTSNGIRVQPPGGKGDPITDFNVLIEGNEVFDIKIGCERGPGCKGAHGNAVLIWRTRGVQVLGNRLHDVDYSCFRASGAESTILTGNWCEGGSWDAGAYFEFSFEGAVVTDNYFVGSPTGKSSGLALANCAGQFDGKRAVVSRNLIEGFKGWLQLKAECEAIVTDNVVNCDDPRTPERESGYFGILAGASHAGRAVQIKDNLVMNCAYGIGVNNTGERAGPPIWVEGNAFQDVEVPITGYVLDFRAFREREAHRSLVPGGHVIENNRDALTLAPVVPQ